MASNVYILAQNARFARQHRYLAEVWHARMQYLAESSARKLQTLTGRRGELDDATKARIIQILHARFRNVVVDQRTKDALIQHHFSTLYLAGLGYFLPHRVINPHLEGKADMSDQEALDIGRAIFMFSVLYPFPRGDESELRPLLALAGSYYTRASRLRGDWEVGAPDTKNRIARVITSRNVVKLHSIIASLLVDPI